MGNYALIDYFCPVEMVPTSDFTMSDAPRN